MVFRAGLAQPGPPTVHFGGGDPITRICVLIIYASQPSRSHSEFMYKSDNQIEHSAYR
jgi:hypothetical protein